jgi:hypothetical protein
MGRGASETEARMRERQLFPDGDFVFIDGGGEQNEAGKSYYPALLRLYMEPTKAWQIVFELLRQLEMGESIIDGTFLGSIQRQNEEGNPLKMDGSKCDE